MMTMMMMTMMSNASQHLRAKSTNQQSIF
jgi:hypothetical protein